MASVCGTLGWQQGYLTTQTGQFGWDQGYGNSGQFGWEQGYGKEVGGSFGFELGYRHPIQDAFQQLLENPDLISVVTPHRTIFRSDLQKMDFSMKLWLVDGAEYEAECSGFNITTPVNGPISWQAMLGPDSSRLYVPKPTTGNFIGRLKGGDVNDSGVKRYWKVEIRTSGEPWVATHLIRNDYTWTLTDRGFQAVIAGTDLSEVLVLCKDKNFGDFKSSRSRIYTLHEVMGAILSGMGIAYRFDFDDAPLAQFTAIGQPMSLLQNLIGLFQLEWFFDNNVFVVREPRYKPNGPSKWKFTDGHRVKKAVYRASGAGIINEAVMEKQERAADIAAEFNEERYGILGYNTVNFDPPRTGITVDVLEARHGSCAHFVYNDANGNFLALTPGPYLGPIPAASCTFLYIDGAPDLIGENQATNWPPGVKPRCHVIWYAADPFGLPSLFDKYYIQRYRDAASQTEWGTRREPAEQSTQIAYPSQAYEIAKRKVVNSQRLANILNAELILWAWTTRAETIGLKLSVAGWTDWTYWYTESVTKTITQSSFGMSLQLSRLLDPSTE